MNSFYDYFFVHGFRYVLPLLCFHGAKHDGCSAQWCHQSSGKQVFRPVGPTSPLIRAYFSEAMDHTPLSAVHKNNVQAIRTYAEALFLAP